MRMPILDSSVFEGRDALPDSLRCDVCIIGTGPAGATIARELSNTRLRVTVLESGGTERRDETDALNEIESVGRPRVMDQWQGPQPHVWGPSPTLSGPDAPLDGNELQPRDRVTYLGGAGRATDTIPTS